MKSQYHQKFRPLVQVRLRSIGSGLINLLKYTFSYQLLHNENGFLHSAFFMQIRQARVVMNFLPFFRTVCSKGNFSHY